MLGNEKFKFDTGMRDGKKVVFLKGVIDEDAEFSGIKKAGGPYIFNFKGITSINSLGIRAWVNFLKEIAGTSVEFEECPPLIVRQMNMVPSFLGHAGVLSVFAPYVCESCDAERFMLVKAEIFESGNIPETAPCDACKKGEMELDGHPKQYFAFAASAKRAA